jgi:outer membrane biogenesis lipoprotein LolB
MSELHRELVKAEWDEFPPDNKARYQQKAQEGDTHAYWQQEAKRLGLKGTMGKTRDELKALVQDEVARLASAADSEQPAS